MGTSQWHQADMPHREWNVRFPRGQTFEDAGASIVSVANDPQRTLKLVRSGSSTSASCQRAQVSRAVAATPIARADDRVEPHRLGSEALCLEALLARSTDLTNPKSQAIAAP